MGEVERRMALGARFCPPANLSKELKPALVNHWGSANTATIGDYDRLAGEQWVADLIHDIRNGEEWKKSWLPFRCAHFYRFAFGRRNQNSLLKEAFLWQTTVDIDDCDAEKQQAALERALQLNEETDGAWQGMVLQMERSARGKVHIDIRMPIGMTIQEAQLAFIQALGVDVKPDSTCFSPERIIFISGRSEEILRSPDWYTLLPKEEVEERYAKLKERKLEPWTVQKDLELKVKGLELRDKSLENPKPEALNSKPEDSKLEFKGLPYSAIIAEWWKLNGGVPQIGERNVKLYQLALNLRAICDNNQGLLLQIMPRLGLEEKEMEVIVESACKEPPKGLSKILRQTIDHTSQSLRYSSPNSGEQLNTARPNVQCSMFNVQ